MSWKKVVGRAHKKRDVWWERAEMEGAMARANFSAPAGSTAWAFMHGPDIVHRARLNHPEWFEVRVKQVQEDDFSALFIAFDWVACEMRIRRKR